MRDFGAALGQDAEARLLAEQDTKTYRASPGLSEDTIPRIARAVASAL